ncbi:hypothetical protein V6N11_076741 [Hibiscus sabdariffa]|uniref:Uncharacterized protein n=2 Tax=Hibiscus sabdariffa TaxID=183260 RepID=A0ABR2AT70_9ROSI
MMMHLTKIEDLKLLYPPSFENMHNLRYIHFDVSLDVYWIMSNSNKKLLANEGVDSVSLPDELRYLCWMFYPFKSLSPSFNPRNLVVLILTFSDIKQLWNKERSPGAINLRSLKCQMCDNLVELTCFSRLSSLETLDVLNCKKLRKISDLSGAINLKWLDCEGCVSLVELPCLSHLKCLKELNLRECYKIKKFPELPRQDVFELDLSYTAIGEVPDSIHFMIMMLVKKNVLSCYSGIAQG